MEPKTTGSYPVTKRLRIAIALGIFGIAIVSIVLLTGNIDQEKRGYLIFIIAMIVLAQAVEFVYEKALISYWQAVAIFLPLFLLVMGFIMHYYWQATIPEIIIVLTIGMVLGPSIGHLHPERKALDERYRQRKKMKEEAKRAR